MKSNLYIFTKQSIYACIFLLANLQLMANAGTSMHLSEASPSCDIGVAVIEEAATGCHSNTITLIASLPDYQRELFYNWSDGQSGDTIQVTTPGTYMVTITNIIGCAAIATYHVDFLYENSLSSYTILATDEVHLHGDNIVINGGVGVYNGGHADIHDNTFITLPTTFLQAEDSDIDDDSEVSNIIESEPSVALPPFLENHFSSDNNLVVPAGTIMIINDQFYNKIEIKEDATVIFTQKDIFISDEFIIKKGATVNFVGCSFVRVTKKIVVEERAHVNLSGQEVNFYVSDNAEIKKGVQFFGNIYAPNHEIKAEGSDDMPTSMAGSFIGKKVKGSGPVSWDWNAYCEPTCEPDFPDCVIDCDCDGGIQSLSLVYNGPDGGTVEAFYDDNISLGTFNNLTNGDTILVDATAIGETKLKSNTSFFANGGSEIQYHTSCSDDILNQTIGALTVIGWLDGEGAICSEGTNGTTPELPIICNCDGGIQSLSLVYNGSDGATVEAFYDGDVSLGVFENVNNGDVLLADATAIGETKLKGSTSFFVNGGSEIEFHTSCSVDLYEVQMGELTVVGLIDAEGSKCGAAGGGISPELPEICDCEDQMVQVSVRYNGPSGVDVLALFDETTMLASFNNVVDGQILTVNAADIGEIKLENTTSFLTNTSDTPSEFHTSCSQDIVGLTVGEFTAIGWSDVTGNICGDDGTPTNTCNCMGGLVNVVLQYNGTSGAVIQVTYDDVTPPSIFTNVNSNTLIILERAPVLSSTTTVRVNEDPELILNTTCPGDIINQTFGDFLVTGWLDTQGNSCPNSGRIMSREDSSKTESSGSFINNLYPNPTSTHLTLEVLSAQKENSQLEIYDVYGNLKSHQAIEVAEGTNNYTMDVNHLPPGIYYVVLPRSKAQNKRVTFVKARL